MRRQGLRGHCSEEGVGTRAIFKWYYWRHYHDYHAHYTRARTHTHSIDLGGKSSHTRKMLIKKEGPTLKGHSKGCSIARTRRGWRVCDMCGMYGFKNGRTWGARLRGGLLRHGMCLQLRKA